LLFWAIHRRDLAEKSVAAARNSLNEARAFGGVTERFTNFTDRFVETVIEVNDRSWPEPAAQLFPGYQLSRSFQQHRQHLEGLLLQFQAHAPFAEFAGSEIDFEEPKAQTIGRPVGRHRKSKLEATRLAFFHVG
jgi:hypothetical protein